MGRTTRLSRWMLLLSGAAIVLQTGSCMLTGSTAQTDFVRQLIVPRLSSLLSDAVFFFLDNAFVRLTT